MMIPGLMNHDLRTGRYIDLSAVDLNRLPFSSAVHLLLARETVGANLLNTKHAELHLVVFVPPISGCDKPYNRRRGQHNEHGRRNQPTLHAISSGLEILISA